MPIKNDLNDRNASERERFTGRSAFEDSSAYKEMNFGSSSKIHQMPADEDEGSFRLLQKMLFGGFVGVLILYVTGFSFFSSPEKEVAPPATNSIQVNIDEEELARIAEELEATLGEGGEVSAAIQAALTEVERALQEAQLEANEEQASALEQLAEGLRGGFNDAQYDDELLEGMGSWMEEMGYEGLTKADLIQLRAKGVTATFTNGIRELGYDPTLDELVRLRQNDVSSRFAAMMQTLGYELGIEDMIRLRRADVTAYYTSNLHDMGYRDITPDQLIRFKQVGVSTSDIKKLMIQQNETPTINEILRYKISNQ